MANVIILWSTRNVHLCLHLVFDHEVSDWPVFGVPRFVSLIAWLTYLLLRLLPLLH